MSDKWRLIIDDPGHPVWNMAVDEALLHMQNTRKTNPVLRFYTWDRAALSIGHFQKTDSIPVDKLNALNICPVGRITGGAAVLHQNDLTYSVAARIEGNMRRGILDSCQYICKGLLEGLKRLDIKAEFGEERSSRNRPASCFVVFAPTDIVYQGRKLVGSAQHRKGEALLQHGSIVLRDNSRLLEELFGYPAQDSIALEHILTRPVTEEELINALRKGFSRALGIELEESGLNMEERKTAEQLVEVVGRRWPQKN